jgi:hypothetical protein
MRKEGTPMKGMETKSNKVLKVPKMCYSERSGKARLAILIASSTNNIVVIMCM